MFENEVHFNFRYQKRSLPAKAENPRKVLRVQKTRSHLRKMPPTLKKMPPRGISMTMISKMKLKMNMLRWVIKFEILIEINKYII